MAVMGPRAGGSSWTASNSCSVEPCMSQAVGQDRGVYWTFSSKLDRAYAFELGTGTSEPHERSEHHVGRYVHAAVGSPTPTPELEATFGKGAPQ